MAITLVGAVGSSGAGSPLSVDLSTLSVASGDVAILGYMNDFSSATHSQTAGGSFTQIDSFFSTAGRDRTSSLWYRVLDGTESTITFTSTSSSEEAALLCTVWRGVDTVSGPFDVTYVQATHMKDAPQNNTNFDAATIVTNTDGAVVVLIETITHDEITATGAPTDYTIAGDELASYANVVMAYKEVATAGTEDPGAWNHIGFAVSEAVHFTIALMPGAASASILPQVMHYRRMMGVS